MTKVHLSGTSLYIPNRSGQERVGKAASVALYLAGTGHISATEKRRRLAALAADGWKARQALVLALVAAKRFSIAPREEIDAACAEVLLDCHLRNGWGPAAEALGLSEPEAGEVLAHLDRQKKPPPRYRSAPPAPGRHPQQVG